LSVKGPWKRVKWEASGKKPEIKVMELKSEEEVNK
jgi:hypothetical protein